MKIIGSDLSLYNERSYLRHEQRLERVSMRASSNPQGTARVSISAEARTAASMPAYESKVADDSEGSHDPNLGFLIQLIEAITGQPVRLFDARELQGAGADSEASDASTAPPARSNESANASSVIVDIERRQSISETEHTRFEAEGIVKTADGREIAFQISLEMARSYRESSVEHLRIGVEPQRKDPLVLNFNGNAASLLDQRFSFDLDADDSRESIARLGSGSGYLVFDRNDDGRVNDGRELFGALSGDGFADLEALDVDANGWVDSGDAAFHRLRLWTPDSSGGGELLALNDRGVAAISTANVASAFSLRGSGNADLGAIRSTGLYLTDSGGVGTVQQIDLTV